MTSITNISVFDPTGNVAPQLKKLRVMIYNFCKLEDGSLMKSINLRDYGIDSGQVVDNATVQVLAELHPRLEHLNLSNCNEVSDVGLWAIAKHCIHLRGLILHKCHKITSVGIRSLALRCIDLKSIDVSFCDLLDDTALTVIAGGTWHIEELNFSYCTKVSDNGLARVAQGLGPYLTKLDFTGCPQIGEFGDRGLKEISYYCHSLTELVITQAKRVEDSGIHCLTEGCNKMQTLVISGCDTLTKKSLKSISENFSSLKRLKLIQNRKINDVDYAIFDKKPIQQTLVTLELQKFDNLTDKGIAVICQVFQGTLLYFSLLECRQITDYSGLIIGNYIPEVRSIDVSFCGNITDNFIHFLSRKLTKLTVLKLDGNPSITSRALLSHIGKDFEFVSISTSWLGYQPKVTHIETLIAEKDMKNLQINKAVKIQCLIRRRFAHKIYWERYQEHLLNSMIPLFQGHVRGFQQRKRFRQIQLQLLKIKNVIKIQTKFRKYYAVKQRMAMLKKKKYLEYCKKLALTIQRLYRGHKDRVKTDKIRNEVANKKMEESQKRAMQEIKANQIQRIYRGYVARQKVISVKVRLEQKVKEQKLRKKCILCIQRIMRGKIGRLAAKHRREEIVLAMKRWTASIVIQRVFRGHVGRERFKRIKAQRILEVQIAACIVIQRNFRGYRGRILAAVAKALRVLRMKQQHCAMEIQRFLRGCMGRYYFSIEKANYILHKKRLVAAITIQRMSRGHKGREISEVERALQTLESTAKPLLLHLHKLENEYMKLKKFLHKLENTEKLISENIFNIERELEHCSTTTNKYTDSTRINGTPQRFLTKFLKIRLKDYLDHDTASI